MKTTSFKNLASRANRKLRSWVTVSHQAIKVVVKSRSGKVVVGVLSFAATVYGTYVLVHDQEQTKSIVAPYVQAARQSADEGKYDDALALVNQGLLVDVRNSELHDLKKRFELLNAIQKSIPSSRIEKEVRLMLEKSPDDIDLRVGIGVLLHHQSRYKESIQELDRVVQGLLWRQNLSESESNQLRDAMYSLCSNYLLADSLGRFDAILLAYDSLIVNAKEPELDRAYSMLMHASIDRIRGNEKNVEKFLFGSLAVFRSKRDKSREVLALLEIVKHYIDGNKTDKASEYCEQLVEIASLQGAIRAQYIGLQLEGEILSRQCKYEEAITAFRNANSLDKGKDDPQTRATILTRIGNLHLFREQFVEAKASFDEAVAIYREINNSFNLAVSLNNLGAAMIGLRYVEAKTKIEEARVIFDMLPFPFGVLNCDLNLGIFMQDVVKDPKDALKVFEGLLNKLPKKGYEGFQAGIYAQMGLAYRDAGNLVLAKKFLKLALSLVKDDLCMTSKINSDLANVEQRQRDGAHNKITENHASKQ